MKALQEELSFPKQAMKSVPLKIKPYCHHLETATINRAWILPSLVLRLVYIKMQLM